jgi:hypothetical protein
VVAPLNARPLRITTRCGSMEDFILTFGLFAVDNTLFIGTKTARKVGQRQRCDILLVDGQPLLRGVAEIVAVDSGAQTGCPGMRIKMLELDASSQEMHKKIVRYARLLAEDKTPQLPFRPSELRVAAPAPARTRIDEIDAGWDDIPVPLPPAVARAAEVPTPVPLPPPPEPEPETEPPPPAPVTVVAAPPPAPAPAAPPRPVARRASPPEPTSTSDGFAYDLTDASTSSSTPAPSAEPDISSLPLPSSLLWTPARIDRCGLLPAAIVLLLVGISLGMVLGALLF